MNSLFLVDHSSELCNLGSRSLSGFSRAQRLMDKAASEEACCCGVVVIIVVVILTLYLSRSLHNSLPRSSQAFSIKKKQKRLLQTRLGLIQTAASQTVMPGMSLVVPPTLQVASLPVNRRLNLLARPQLHKNKVTRSPSQLMILSNWISSGPIATQSPRTSTLYCRAQIEFWP